MDWGEIFGFLVFLAIGGFSVLHKIYEERKLEQGRKERKESRPEDLPEATRRMLYGDDADPRTFSPPVAKPRTARPLSTGPAPLPPLAQPRSVPPRRMPAPVRAEMDEAERKAGWENERVPDENAPSRETAPPPVPSLQQQREQVQRTMQQAWQQAQKRKQQAEAQRMQARHRPPAAPQPPTAPPQRPSRPVPAPASMRTPGPDIRLLRMDHRTLVQGIVLQEVLGPPRALRPYGD